MNQNQHDPSPPTVATTVTAVTTGTTSRAAHHLSAQSASEYRYSGPCLLFHLQPIRQRLHPYLSACDAVCLMRTSRSITASILCGYGILDYKHASHYQHRTVAEVKQSIALFDRYNIRILAMCLPKEWDEPLVDAVSGATVLPPSLLVLALGALSFSASGEALGWLESAVCSVMSGSVQSVPTCQQHQPAVEEDGSEAAEFYRLMRDVGAKTGDPAWSVDNYGGAVSPFNHPIPPGALPRQLRALQFSDAYNQPLQPGSIPSTVEMIQFGDLFNQPLAVGHLPPALVTLAFGGTDKYQGTHPLLPGVLPAGLKQIAFCAYLTQPLLPGVLPSQLEDLDLGLSYNHPLPPGVVPPSVKRLSLSSAFDHPLQVGSVPEGVRHLNLGFAFGHPLLPGVLPSSLRELVFDWQFNQPLQPSSLPSGLEVLAFGQYSIFSQQVQPGVIPASVRAVSMGVQYRQKLVEGGIPASVEWLRLPRQYTTAKKLKNSVKIVSPTTRIVWHGSSQVWVPAHR